METLEDDTKYRRILLYLDAAMSHLLYLCFHFIYSGNLVGLQLVWKPMCLCICKCLEKLWPQQVTVYDFPFWEENTNFKGNQSVEQVSIKCWTEVNQRLGMNASKFSLWKCKNNLFRSFIASYHLFHAQRSMAAFITRLRTKCRKSKGERERLNRID